MALDTLPTADVSGAQQSLSPTAANLDSGLELARTLSHAMWQQDRSLVLSQVVGVGPTGVGQNGLTTLQNTAGFIRPLASPAIRLPPIQARLERFLTLAKWVGRVQRVDDESFVALVQDQLENRPEEEVEFARSEVAPVDERLLAPGAVFYWSIGYRDRIGGQRTRESIIRFRRLPSPSLVDVTDAEEWARGIQAVMDHDTGRPVP